MGVKKTLENVKGLVLDMDGTIYIGSKPLPGAPEAVNKLRKKLRLVFMTNNSTMTRAKYLEKLHRMGIHASVSEILTSGYLAARYVAAEHPGARVLVVGEEGISAEARQLGLRIIEHSEWKSADYVVTGLDRHFTYQKAADAARAIRNGAKFIATNLDNIYPTEEGFMPGAGSIVAMLSAATGVKPLSVGKPSITSSQMALETSGLQASEVIFVGDRVDTDVAAARMVGARCILVKTGAFELFRDKTSDADMVIESLAELPSLLSIE
ncbi:MAG: HAD-IIA family hydrolase [Candidatus Caldarchaeum sp.]